MRDGNIPGEIPTSHSPDAGTQRERERTEGRAIERWIEQKEGEQKIIKIN